jgi:hypothetical protein
MTQGINVHKAEEVDKVIKEVAMPGISGPVTFVFAPDRSQKHHQPLTGVPVLAMDQLAAMRGCKSVLSHSTAPCGESLSL